MEGMWDDRLADLAGDIGRELSGHRARVTVRETEFRSDARVRWRATVEAGGETLRNAFAPTAGGALRKLVELELASLRDTHGLGQGLLMRAQMLGVGVGERAA